MKKITTSFIAVLVLISLPVNAVLVTLDITFDEFPEDTSFSIWDDSFLPAFEDGSISPFESIPYDVNLSSPIGFGDGFVFPDDFVGVGPGPWQFVWDLAPGSYFFVISDTFGDGICCTVGDGDFTLSVDGNAIFAGGEFTDFALINFDIVGTPVPLPGAVMLFGSLIAGWVGFGRRRS